jgi:hypothetical protein
LEDTPESLQLNRTIYTLFKDQIAEEVERLTNEEGYSLTWATSEIPFLIAPVVGVPPKDQDALHKIIATLPMYITETEVGRQLLSVEQLKELGSFSTVESETLRSAERMVRELPALKSVSQLINATGDRSAILPNGAVVCNISSAGFSFQTVLNHFQISEISASARDRRIDFKWKVKTQGDNWFYLDLRRTGENTRSEALISRMIGFLTERLQRSRNNIFVGLRPITIDGLDEYLGIKAYNSVFLSPWQPVTKFIASYFGDNEALPLGVAYAYLAVIIGERSPALNAEAEILAYVHRAVAQIETQVGISLEDKDKFLDALVSSSIGVFDPLIWNRRVTSDGWSNIYDSAYLEI